MSNLWGRRSFSIDCVMDLCFAFILVKQAGSVLNKDTHCLLIKEYTCILLNILQFAEVTCIPSPVNPTATPHIIRPKPGGV